MGTHLPDSLVKIIQEASKPKIVLGRWRKPSLSKRKLAILKKKFSLNGFQFPEVPQPYKSPEQLMKAKKFKPPKMKIRERQKPARLQKIKENLEKMPKMIEEWRKSNKLEKHKQFKGLDLMQRRVSPMMEDFLKKMKEKQEKKYEKETQKNQKKDQSQKLSSSQIPLQSSLEKERIQRVRQLQDSSNPLHSKSDVSSKKVLKSSDQVYLESQLD